MRIDRDFCGYGKAGAGIGRCFALVPPADDNERLGPVLADALLSISPARFVIDDEAGVGVGRCFALDTASEICD